MCLQQTLPVSGGYRGGWCYNYYDKNNKNNKNNHKNAKKFRQQIVDQGEHILKIYNKSLGPEETKIDGNCLNPEAKTTKKTTIKKTLKKITAFCLFALLLTGWQKPATKEMESIAVKEETAQPATTVLEKQEPVQAKEKNCQRYMTGKMQGLYRIPITQILEKAKSYRTRIMFSTLKMDVKLPI